MGAKCSKLPPPPLDILREFGLCYSIYLVFKDKISKTARIFMFFYFSDNQPLQVFFKLPVSEISEIDDHKSVSLDLFIVYLIRNLVIVSNFFSSS